MSTEAVRKPSVLFHMSAEIPKVPTTEAVKDSDVVITMGCGLIASLIPAAK
jgi:arsenate reductase